MENEIKSRILSMIEKEARKRGVEFRRVRKGRSYQFSIGNARGIIKYTSADGDFWVGVMLETIRELGDNAFLVEVDECMNRYIVIPFSEVKKWNLHANKPLRSSKFRRVGYGYVIQATHYKPIHIANVGSPEALNVIFET